MSTSRMFLRCYLVPLVLSILLVTSSLALKIGIIGAGIGGASTAYFLRNQTNKNQEIEIDVFDDHETAGGRVCTVEIGGRFYEAGGAILHPDNHYMLRFVESLGLKKREDWDGGMTGFWKDGEMKFTIDSSEWKMSILLKLLWRYGLDPVKLSWNIREMLTKFSGIYGSQSNFTSFTTPQDLLHSMSPEFTEELGISIEDHLYKAGFSERFIEEFVTVAVKINYRQPLDVPAFVGSVALAGAEPGLWAVHGGNYQVPENLLKTSGSNRHQCRVKSVGKIQESQFRIVCDSGDAHGPYDAVVLAAPLMKNLPPPQKQIDLSEIGNLSALFGTYRQCVATFVRGSPKWQNWKLSNDVGYTEIFHLDTTADTAGLGLVLPVDWTIKEPVPSGTERVWKMFSADSLSKETLYRMFERIEEVQERKFLAYPEYLKGSFPKGPLSFEPVDSFFHLNSIEWMASAMEMSAIAGRNIANAILRKFAQIPESNFKKENVMHDEF